MGLSAALHLKTVQPQLKILVLERGLLPSGASTKNAGFACFGTVSEQLAALKGSTEQEVLQMVDYKWRGLQKLRANLGDAAIHYQQHGGYELFMDDKAEQANHCIDQLAHINQLLGPVVGDKIIYTTVEPGTTDFGFKKICRMIYNPYEGQIDTGKMMRALLSKVYDLGILVLNGCTIEKITNDGTQIKLTTNHGVFKAAKVIIATNAFAAKLYPGLKVTPGRGQGFSDPAYPGLKIKGTFHFDEGYYYFRNIHDRILFGGGRNLNIGAEATWDFGHTALVKEKLTSYLKDVILPGQDVEIDYWWSGIMGFGETTPIIKEVEPNVFCAVRCNGMGVAMGSLVGEEVAEMAYPSR